MTEAGADELNVVLGLMKKSGVSRRTRFLLSR
jgi:hypothetical protein